MKALLLVASGLVALLAVSPASALTIDFTITNTTGNDSTGCGCITGQIFGLSANGTGQAATDVVVDTTPSNYPSNETYPLSTIANASQNSFTVVGGVITSFDYDASTGTPSGGYQLQLITSAPAFDFVVEENSSYLVAANGVSQSDVSATPLPAALPMFASVLGGIGVFGWRKKRKDAAALAAA